MILGEGNVMVLLGITRTWIVVASDGWGGQLVEHGLGVGLCLGVQ